MRRVVMGVLALALLAQVGCATSDYMKAGDNIRGENPHAAIEYYSLALKGSPGDQAIIDKIEEVAKEIADKHNSYVQGAKASKKYDQAVADCDRVISTQNFIDQGSSKIQIYHDREERSQMANLAAGKHYEKGDRLAKQQSFKKAAKDFRRCLGFVAGYKDAQARYDDCKKQAMVQLGFVRFDYANSANQGLANQFKTDLHGLLADLNPEFLQVTMGRPSGPGTRHLITGTVNGGFEDKFRGWKSTAQKNTKTFERGTGEFDANGLEITESYDVTATWVLHERETSAVLELKYSIQREDRSAVVAGTARLNAKDYKSYASDFGGDTGDPNYNDVIPYEIRELGTDRIEPYNFDQLAGQMVAGWSKKGQPLYKFAHKIFGKYK